MGTNWKQEQTDSAMWGGSPKSSEDEIARYRQMGFDAGAVRQGPQLDTSRFDAQGVNQDQARQSQMQALQYLRNTANGGPTAAQAQLQSGQRQAMAGQSALAHAARGGGANLVAANRAAAVNGGQMGLAGANQLQQLRTTEQMNAQGALANGLGQQRQMDLNSAGQLGDLASYQGQAALQQRAIDDSARKFYEDQASGVLGANQNAHVASELGSNAVETGMKNVGDQLDKTYFAAGLGLGGDATSLLGGALAGGGGQPDTQRRKASQDPDYIYSDSTLKHKVKPATQAVRNALRALKGGQ